MSSPSVFSGFRVTRPLVFHVVFCRWFVKCTVKFVGWFFNFIGQNSLSKHRNKLTKNFKHRSIFKCMNQVQILFNGIFLGNSFYLSHIQHFKCSTVDGLHITYGVSGFRVTRPLVFHVVFCRWLFFLFSFDFENHTVELFVKILLYCVQCPDSCKKVDRCL
jgi:hypothetical protein